jgi:thiamine-phosphate diphosphorylase
VIDACLRLILVTDGIGDPARLQQIVTAAIEGGVRCVQLREPSWSARQLLLACETLRPILDSVQGLLLVNDRLDVAATGAAHGAQIGYRSLPPEQARKVVGPDCVLGYSAHNAAELALAAQHGCDFALLSPVWPTSSKPNVAPLEVSRAAQLTEHASLPVVWLGGANPTTIHQIQNVAALQRPVGVAVLSAIMQSDDPKVTAAQLLASCP